MLALFPVFPAPPFFAVVERNGAGKPGRKHHVISSTIYVTQAVSAMEMDTQPHKDKVSSSYYMINSMICGVFSTYNLPQKNSRLKATFSVGLPYTIVEILVAKHACSHEI